MQTPAGACKALDPAVIRVLIADDHPVVCLGLLGIINGQSDMTVVGQARTGSEAVALAIKHCPEVIVLTTYQGDEDIRRALAAGAQSYLLKGMSHLKLLEAIRSVCAGHTYVPR